MNRKRIFDAIRDERGHSFTTMEVAAIDALLDTLEKPMTLKTGPAGIELIKTFEGLELKAYPDPGTGGEPWTIGIGTTVYPNGQKVRPGDVITEAQAEEYLAHDLERFERAVLKATGGKASQHQFDALVSFFYNVGEGAGSKSTLIKKHKAGDYAGAKAEFAKWNKAAGRVLAGLSRRRAAEAQLYGSAA